MSTFGGAEGFLVNVVVKEYFANTPGGAAVLYTVPPGTYAEINVIFATTGTILRGSGYAAALEETRGMGAYLGNDGDYIESTDNGQSFYALIKEFKKP